MKYFIGEDGFMQDKYGFPEPEVWKNYISRIHKMREEGRHRIPISVEEQEFRQTHREEIAAAREEWLNKPDLANLPLRYAFCSNDSLDAETLAMHDVAYAVSWVDHFMRRREQELTAEPVRKFLEKAIDPKTNALPENAGWQLRQLAREVVDEAVKRER